MQQPEITLAALGWTTEREEAFAPLRPQGLEPARVAVEDKHHYEVLTPHGLYLAQIPGKMLHEARSAAQLPKVGDWVACACIRETGRAMLRAVLPRRNQLSRKAPGRESEEQVLVTNLERAFIVTSLDRPFNPRLIERFLIMVRESGAQPVVVLNKADVGGAEETLALAAAVAGDAPMFAVSAKTGLALPKLRRMLTVGETAVFLGPSGVGKSTLINRLYGDEVQATTEVRAGDSRGRHTTTWRELIVLPRGGLVIDTPGLREFHLWAAAAGLLEAFQDIEDLAVQCRFRRCTHTTEAYCSVRAALEAAQLSPERFANYQRLRQEQSFLEQTQRRWERPKTRWSAQVGGRKPKRPV